MIEIQVLNKKTANFTNWTVDKYQIVAPIPATSFGQWISADPGTVNMGLAELYSLEEVDIVNLWQIKLDRQNDAIDRLYLAWNIIVECLEEKSRLVGFKIHRNFILEGASFGNNFRQVELAEQRAIIAWWGLTNAYQVKFVPPTTIRKKVFGSGKIKAHEAWQLSGIPKNKQPNDALAALACAYYGAMS